MSSDMRSTKGKSVQHNHNQEKANMLDYSGFLFPSPNFSTSSSPPSVFASGIIALLTTNTINSATIFDYVHSEFARNMHIGKFRVPIIKKKLKNEEPPKRYEIR